MQTYVFIISQKTHHLLLDFSEVFFHRFAPCLFISRCEAQCVHRKKLWVLLIQRDISKVTLRKEVGIAAGTMSKLNKGEEVALPILLRICDYLDCDIGDICEAVREEK